MRSNTAQVSVGMMIEPDTADDFGSYIAQVVGIPAALDTCKVDVSILGSEFYLKDPYDKYLGAVHFAEFEDDSIKEQLLEMRIAGCTIDGRQAKVADLLEDTSDTGIPPLLGMELQAVTPRKGNQPFRPALGTIGGRRITEKQLIFFVSGLYAWNGEVLLGDEATVLDVMRIKVADGRELWQTVDMGVTEDAMRAHIKNRQAQKVAIGALVTTGDPDVPDPSLIIQTNTQLSNALYDAMIPASSVAGQPASSSSDGSGAMLQQHVPPQPAAAVTPPVQQRTYRRITCSTTFGPPQLSLPGSPSSMLQPAATPSGQQPSPSSVVMVQAPQSTRSADMGAIIFSGLQ